MRCLGWTARRSRREREVTNAAFPAGEGYAQETVEGSKRLFIPHFIATH